MDLAAIATGVGILKSGFDALRTALGLVKDVQEALPSGEKKETVGRALEEADKQLRLGEAQIAQAFGYPLCRCAFPPTPMLAVGYRLPMAELDNAALLALVQRGHASSPSAFPVHECPKCGANDAGPYVYDRTAPPHGKPPPVTNDPGK
jgi:hypothetical protein